jgi:hypothetical protein
MEIMFIVALVMGALTAQGFSSGALATVIPHCSTFSPRARQRRCSAYAAGGAPSRTRASVLCAAPPKLPSPAMRIDCQLAIAEWLRPRSRQGWCVAVPQSLQLPADRPRFPIGCQSALQPHAAPCPHRSTKSWCAPCRGVENCACIISVAIATTRQSHQFCVGETAGGGK